MTEITLIAALNHNRVIGDKGTIPWHLPNDMAFFMRTTVNHTVVMGRKTFESLPGQKPLKDRKHIILSKTWKSEHPDVCVFSSLTQLKKSILNEKQVFIIGGSALYQAFLPEASEMILTLVDNQLVGDTHFPLYEPTDWTRQHIESHQPDTKHAYGFSIQRFRRKKTNA